MLKQGCYFSSKVGKPTKASLVQAQQLGTSPRQPQKDDEAKLLFLIECWGQPPKVLLYKTNSEGFSMVALKDDEVGLFIIL